MFIRFNDDTGIQEEIVLSDPDLESGTWYEVPDDTDLSGRLYKLTSGAPKKMTAAAYDKYLAELNKSSVMMFLRDQRDELLSKSDWTQLESSPLSEEKKAEWEVYRNALRALPESVDENLQYELPTPPTA